MQNFIQVLLHFQKALKKCIVSCKTNEEIGNSFEKSDFSLANKNNTPYNRIDADKGFRIDGVQYITAPLQNDNKFPLSAGKGQRPCPCIAF